MPKSSNRMPDVPPTWREVRRERLLDCKVFGVTRATMASPHTGDEHPFFTIDAATWVNVVAVTPEDEVIMVRQFRHGSGSVTLEIAGGIVDPGEDPTTAAARELLEETGFLAGRVTPLGSVNPNPALFGNRCFTFLAEGCKRVQDIENGPTEETAAVLVPKAEIPSRVASGEIDHALVVAGLYLWALQPSGR